MRFTWLSLCLSGSLALAGCQTFRTASRPVPFEHKLAREQLVVHSDFPLTEKEHPLIDELAAHHEWLTAKLRLAATDVPIHVYLFADEAAYYDFLALRFPGFPSRRAIFVETDAEFLEATDYRGAEQMRDRPPCVFERATDVVEDFDGVVPCG